MSGFDGFTTATTGFLADLTLNNDRDWFTANKKTFDREVTGRAKAFVTALGERFDAEMPGVHAEPRVNGSIFRINRDTRFSADKTPYKPWLDMMFWLGEGRSRDKAGYFFRMTPTTLYLGAGKHGFDKEQLQTWREAVDDDARGAALVAALAAVQGAGDYGVGGEHYKRVPRGYDAEHPRADLLRYKALWVGCELPLPDAVYSASLLDLVIAQFQTMAPVADWLAAEVIS